MKKTWKRKKEDKRKQGSQIENLQRSLRDVMQAMNELIAQKDREGGGRLHPAESQMLEYHRIKEEAGTRTAKLRQEKGVQDRHLQADVEALKNLEENLRQLTERDQQLQSQEEQTLS